MKEKLFISVIVILPAEAGPGKASQYAVLSNQPCHGEVIGCVVVKRICNAALYDGYDQDEQGCPGTYLQSVTQKGFFTPSRHLWQYSLKSSAASLLSCSSADLQAVQAAATFPCR